MNKELKHEETEGTDELYAFAMPRSAQLLAQSTEESTEPAETQEATIPDETAGEVVDDATGPEEGVSEGTVDDTEEAPERFVIPYKANGEEREFEYQLDENGRLSAETIAELGKRLAMEGLHEKMQKVRETTREAETRYQRELAERQQLLEDYKARFESVRPLQEAIQRDPRLLAVINQQYGRHMGGQLKPYDPQAVEMQRREKELHAAQIRGFLQEVETEKWSRFQEKHADLTADDIAEIRDFYMENAGNIDRIPVGPDGFPLIDITTIKDQLLDAPDVAYGMMIAKGKLKPKSNTDSTLQQQLDIAKKKATVKNPSAGGKGTNKVPTYVQKGWHELNAEERQARIQYEMENFEQGQYKR